MGSHSSPCTPPRSTPVPASASDEHTATPPAAHRPPCDVEAHWHGLHVRETHKAARSCAPTSPQAQARPTSPQAPRVVAVAPSATSATCVGVSDAAANPPAPRRPPCETSAHWHGPRAHRMRTAAHTSIPIDRRASSQRSAAAAHLPVISRHRPASVHLAQSHAAEALATRFATGAGPTVPHSPPTQRAPL